MSEYPAGRTLSIEMGKSASVEVPLGGPKNRFGGGYRVSGALDNMGIQRHSHGDVNPSAAGEDMQLTNEMYPSDVPWTVMIRSRPVAHMLEYSYHPSRKHTFPLK